MSKRISMSEYVVSFAKRAEKFEVPAEKVESPVSEWQERQIARLGRISEKLEADVSEFTYEPADFADADYILKGMSAILVAACTPQKRQGRKQVERAVQKAQKQVQSPQVDWEALCKSGKLGKVAQKRAQMLAA